MTLRSGHGNGKGEPRIETLPFDELPVGVPAAAGPASPSPRGERGKFAPGNSEARQGGLARAGKTRLADRLGLAVLPEGAAFAPYRAAAVAFRRAQTAELAANVAGGRLGPGPSSMVASAALALGWARYLSDLAAMTGDVDQVALSIKFGTESSQLLAKAHEYAAKEAQARKATAPRTSVAEFFSRKDPK